MDGILVLDEEGKTDCEYSMDESMANEITEYLQKEIIMDFAGYEERSYSERFAREDGSCIDIAACARKDAPGIVAIYYYTSPEFIRNYTLTIQRLLNGYSTRKMERSSLQTRESLLPVMMRDCWDRIQPTTKLFRQ